MQLQLFYFFADIWNRNTNTVISVCQVSYADLFTGDNEHQINDKTSDEYAECVQGRVYPANIYLFKAKNRNSKKSVKYVQS